MLRFPLLATLLTCSLSPAYDVIPKPARVTPSDAPALRQLSEVTERLDPAFQSTPESYAMLIAADSIEIRSHHPLGFQRAHQTLTQLREQLTRSGSLPQGRIHDAPQYAWRGYMLDVARHYMPLKDLKKLATELARYKFNRFHIHLTDDNGWRFEVPGYPKLKSIASHRPETFGNGIPEGGCYTRAELQDFVAHCVNLGMEVIPEMDMPSHNQALAAAYPEFFCQAVGMMVRTGAHAPDKRALLVCPEKEALWVFLDAAMRELTHIFPSHSIHLGGDEAPTTEWDRCPDCLKARQQHGYADGHDQMRAFLTRMAQLARKHDREPLFWYEKDETLYRPDDVVFTWYRNESAKALQAAEKRGFRVILNSSPFTYLDFPQLDGQRHYDWMPVATLKNFYELRPERFPQQAQILGVQCNLWTERVPNLEHVFYQSFPRAMATAEVGWTPAKQCQFPDFQKRVEQQGTDFSQRTGFTLERRVDNQPTLNHKE